MDMTVCIGAICENGSKIVVTADRMVTAEHLSIEFESQERKVLKLTNSCVTMTAGDALAHTEVFKHARSEINSSSISRISQVVEKLKEAFVEERKDSKKCI